MRRIMLLVAVAAMMAAMTVAAGPAFAQGAPNGGCPTGFEEGPNKLNENSNGTQSAFVNESDELCTKELKAKPQAPQFCCDPVITVFRDDTVGGSTK